MKYLMLLMFCTAIGSFVFFAEAQQPGTCQFGNCENGRGKLVYGNGDYYWGRFTGGGPNGYGILINSAGKLQKKGIWKNGELSDQGKCSGNCRDGTGTLVYEGFTKYTGLFKGGLYHGNGSIDFYDETGAVESTFKGKWENDDYTDGIFTWIKYDETYSGQWKMRMKHGKGIWTWNNGQQKYEGGWENGKYSGKGKLTYPGFKVEGVFHYKCSTQDPENSSNNILIYQISNAVAYYYDNTSGPVNNNKYIKYEGDLISSGISRLATLCDMMGFCPCGTGKMTYESGQVCDYLDAWRFADCSGECGKVQ